MRLSSVDAQRGFTLIELMVAATLTLMLMTVISGVLFDSLRMAEILRGKLALNREAREIYDLLAFGGIRLGANINVKTASLAGSTLQTDYKADSSSVANTLRIS
jgi:prepilin-type N-terminal cleavage/methylation domain-containing protein